MHGALMKQFVSFITSTFMSVVKVSYITHIWQSKPRPGKKLCLAQGHTTGKSGVGI